MGKRKRAAILLSRQAMHPCATDAWIKATIRALDWIREQDMALVSSIGMTTWNLITVMAGKRGIAIHLIVAANEEVEAGQIRDQIAADFALDNSRTSFSVIKAGYRRALQIRDHAVVDDADILLPISIRPGGRMERILEESGKAVDRRFLIEYPNQKKRHGYRVPVESVSDQLRAYERTNRPVLVHWTRISNGKWPDETTAEFIAAVVGDKEYPRSAFATLTRIAVSRRILASSQHMPDKTATVSFSGLKPSEVLPLMRWRARYRQMSFEPYGIGVDFQAGLDAGVRPVIYESHSRGSFADAPRWLYQSPGNITDWTNEREFRHCGDFDLGGFDRSKLILFCRYKNEADQLSELTGLKTIHIQK